MKKQIVAFVLAFVATLSLVACSSPTPGPTPIPTPAPDHGTEDLAGSSNLHSTNSTGSAGNCPLAPTHLGVLYYKSAVTPAKSEGIMYLIPFTNLSDGSSYCEPSGLCHGNVIGSPVMFPVSTPSLKGAWTIPSIQRYCVMVQFWAPGASETLPDSDMWVEY